MQLLTPSLGLLFWTTIIFLVVFFLLKKYAWKPILQALDDREKSIDDALRIAENTRKEMEQMKSQHEDLLAQAKQERNTMIKEAKDMKESIITQAKDQAKKEAQGILDEARKEIDNQKMAAFTDLKNQVGNMVIDLSEKILRRELGNKQAQEDFINVILDSTGPNSQN